MVYNQIFGVNLEYGIHNTPKQVDVDRIAYYIPMKSHKSFLARKTNGHTLRLDGFITLMSLFGGFVPTHALLFFRRK